MNVSSWHVGKIVIAWIIAAVIAFIWYHDVRGYLIVCVLIMGVPCYLTWNWFSGKES